MVDAIKRTSPLIEKVDIFDVYEGDKIEAGKKSAAISIVLRDKEKTLDEKQISGVIDKVLNLIAKDYKGQIRQ